MPTPSIDDATALRTHATQQRLLAMILGYRITQLDRSAAPKAIGLMLSHSRSRWPLARDCHPLGNLSAIDPHVPTMITLMRQTFLNPIAHDRG
jgi:hypothetical protein